MNRKSGFIDMRVKEADTRGGGDGQNRTKTESLSLIGVALINYHESLQGDFLLY